MIRNISHLIVVLMISVFLIATARGHDWYPPSCCSGGDCAPIAGERVKPEGAGYLVDGRFHIAKSEVKDSMDGRYHGCFPTAERLLCFFAPPPGS